MKSGPDRAEMLRSRLNHQYPKFQERFSFSSALGRASLSISPVTVADDKANGKFRCELIDLGTDTWKRAIQVQVIGKLESVADYKGVP